MKRTMRNREKQKKICKQHETHAQASHSRIVLREETKMYTITTITYKLVSAQNIYSARPVGTQQCKEIKLLLPKLNKAKRNPSIMRTHQGNSSPGISGGV